MRKAKTELPSEQRSETVDRIIALLNADVKIDMVKYAAFSCARYYIKLLTTMLHLGEEDKEEILEILTQVATKGMTDELKTNLSNLFRQVNPKSREHITENISTIFNGSVEQLTSFKNTIADYQTIQQEDIPDFSKITDALKASIDELITAQQAQKQMQLYETGDSPKRVFTQYLLEQIFAKLGLTQQSYNLISRLADLNDEELSQQMDTLCNQVKTIVGDQDNIERVLMIISTLNKPIVVNMDYQRIENDLNDFVSAGTISSKAHKQLKAYLKQIQVAVVLQPVGEQTKTELKQTKLKAIKIILQACAHFFKNDISDIAIELFFKQNTGSFDDLELWKNSLFAQFNTWMEGYVEESEVLETVKTLIEKLLEDNLDRADLTNSINHLKKSKVFQTSEQAQLLQAIDVLTYDQLPLKNHIEKDKKSLQLLITMQLIRDVCEQAKAPPDDIKAIINSLSKALADGNLEQAKGNAKAKISRLAPRWNLTNDNVQELNDLIEQINSQPAQNETTLEQIKAFYLKLEIKKEKADAIESNWRWVSRMICVGGIYVAIVGYFYKVVQTLGQLLHNSSDVRWYDWLTGGIDFFPFVLLVTHIGWKFGDKILYGLQNPKQSLQSIFYIENGKPTLKTLGAALGYPIALYAVYWSVPTVLLLNAAVVKPGIGLTSFNAVALGFAMLFNIFPVPIIFNSLNEAYRTYIQGRKDLTIYNEARLDAFKSSLLELIDNMTDEAFLAMLQEYMQVYAKAVARKEGAPFAEDIESGKYSKGKMSVPRDEGSSSNPNPIPSAIESLEQELEILFGESFSDLVTAVKIKNTTITPAHSINSEGPSEHTHLVNKDNNNYANKGCTLPSGIECFSDFIVYLKQYEEWLSFKKAETSHAQLALQSEHGGNSRNGFFAPPNQGGLRQRSAELSKNTGDFTLDASFRV